MYRWTTDAAAVLPSPLTPRGTVLPGDPVCARPQAQDRPRRQLRVERLVPTPLPPPPPRSPLFAPLGSVKIAFAPEWITEGAVSEGYGVTHLFTLELSG